MITAFYSFIKKSSIFNKNIVQKIFSKFSHTSKYGTYKISKMLILLHHVPFALDGWYIFNTTGVDLNLQFPAGWQNAKQIKYSQGFTLPAPRDFVGLGPLTELEALSLYNFTLQHNFSLTISYHTQGKEIYWQFLDFMPEGAKQIGETFSKASGYLLAEVPYSSSFAGYKDWFIQDYNRPGFTIEAGIR